MAPLPEIIHLNLGGTLFTTRLETLRKYPSSKLGDMFNGFSHPPKDKDGCFFIDKSGQYFDHILEFLRDDSYLPPVDIVKAVIRDALYFDLKEYVQRLKILQ